MSYKPDAIPVGSIIAWSGGYFTAANNGGTYTSVLGNTVGNANAYLESKGYKVCNGTALNDPKSPIFNGANKFLPDLTNNRFLQGSTIAGSVADQNSFQINVTNLPPFTVDSTYTEYSSVASVASDNHYHAMFAPSTGNQQSYAKIVVSASDYIHNDYITTNNWGYSRTATLAVNAATNVTESFGIPLGGYSAVNAGSAGVASVLNIPNHNHSFVANSTNGFNKTAIDNRPSYLSIFYIIKIK